MLLRGQHHALRTGIIGRLQLIMEGFPEEVTLGLIFLGAAAESVKENLRGKVPPYVCLIETRRINIQVLNVKHGFYFIF